MLPLPFSAEVLLGMGEDECRMYIQQLDQSGMEEDVFISELHVTMNDLSKARLAVPECDVVSVGYCAESSGRSSSPPRLSHGMWVVFCERGLNCMV